MDNYNEESRIFSDKLIFNAMMVVDYFSRVNYKEMYDNKELGDAFVRVYNRFVDELVDRGILEC